MSDSLIFDDPEDLSSILKSIYGQVVTAYEDMPDRWKQLLVTGNHFVMPTSHGFLIFGEIIESEYDEDKKSLAANQHLRLIRGYSVACTEGEIGIQFAWNLFPIPERLFKLAKESKWDLSLETIVEFFALIGSYTLEEDL